MSEKNYELKIMEAYLNDLEESYDKYADFYNSKNSFSAFSELSNIFDGVSKIREIKRSDLKMVLDHLKDSFLRETIRLNNNGWSMPFEEVEEKAKKIDSSEIEKYFNLLLDDFYELNDIKVLHQEIIEKLKMYGEYKENRIYSDSLYSALDIISELQKITPNHHSLRFLNLKILVEKYPENIQNYSKLSDKEIHEVTKAGNPNFMRKMYDMPDGFYERAKELSKNNWSQETIYDELITEFQNGWGDSVPSFSVVYRRLKENKVW